MTTPTPRSASNTTSPRGHASDGSDTIKRRLERALLVTDEHGARGTRLIEDAQRFCKRVNKYIAMGLVGTQADSLALELCCYALQLPLRSPRPVPSGRSGRTNLRERAEAAAEMLMSLIGDENDALIEQTVAILNEVHQRHPATDLAKVLADALNLEDFGVVGLLNQTMTMARQGAGVAQVADGMEKREQYGYWDARLHEGFHFDPVRQIAKKRLEHARKVAILLNSELREDGAV
jgi:hypothetical protein